MFTKLLTESALPAASQVFRAEQSNTAILFDNSYFFKLYRRTEEGIQPEAEMGRFLTETAHFEGVAPFVGTLEYRRPTKGTVTMATVQWYIPSHGDAWTFTLDEVTRFFDRVLSKNGEIQGAPALPSSFLDIDFASIPPLLQELIGGYYPEMAALLGKRTGELHLALASRPDDPEFSPEPFSILYQRSVYQSMRSLARKTIIHLKANLRRLPPETRGKAEWVLAAEPEILKQHGRFLGRKFSAMKIRIHGDYHLGQVLYTGKDFVIVDFEGEPARTMSERRLKRSPLRDVAGMICSFQYASYAALLQHAPVRAEDAALLEPWVETWYRSIAGIFLRSYLESVAGAPFMPKEREETETMLYAFMLDKALYELGYELDNRPEWVKIPLRGIEALIRDFSAETINPPSRTSSPSAL